VTRPLLTAGLFFLAGLFVVAAISLVTGFFVPVYLFLGAGVFVTPSSSVMTDPRLLAAAVLEAVILCAAAVSFSSPRCCIAASV